jgi:hypothetical protein
MEEINGFYDDEGNRVNPDLIPKPGLCLLCRKNDIDDPMENILCSMNRLDQKDQKEFKCGAFESLNS